MSQQSEQVSLPSWWAAQDPKEGVEAPTGHLGLALFRVSEALFTTQNGPPPEARLHWLCCEMKDFLCRCGTRSRLLLHFALFLATWMAPLLVLRPPPLGLLGREQRIEALNRLEASPVGPPVFALKAILSLLYYEHPDALRELGFDGRPMKDIEP